jgi:hypothetical protein
MLQFAPCARRSTYLLTPARRSRRYQVVTIRRAHLREDCKQLARAIGRRCSLWRTLVVALALAMVLVIERLAQAAIEHAAE